MIITFRTERWVAIISICALLLLFTYRLGWTSLESFDEAWYGDIARNLIASGNPFALSFNGQPFTDHPPLGFILMSVPMRVLGVSEFSVRLLSAAMGVGTLLLVYLIGKRLGSPVIGVSAAAILFSSLWFMLRSRSGNLDIPFMFWEVLVAYAVIGQKQIKPYVVVAGMAALILTKTLVGLGILPLLIYVYISQRKKLKTNTLIKSLLLLLVIVLPWYVVNHIQDPQFLYHHVYAIGARGGKNSVEFKAVIQNLQYISFGIGKWYKLFLLALPMSILAWWKLSSQRQNLTQLFVWFLGFSVFLVSTTTEIWHLLPLYPVIALITALAAYNVVSIVAPKIPLLKLLMLGGFLIISVYQFHQFSNLIYAKKPSISKEADAAMHAANLDIIYLMDTFYPAAVYYSQSKIYPLYWDKDAYQKMVELLESTDAGAIITNQSTKNQLEADGVSFTVQYQNEQYYILGERNE